jgi:hypothetical protein
MLLASYRKFLIDRRQSAPLVRKRAIHKLTKYLSQPHLVHNKSLNLRLLIHNPCHAKFSCYCWIREKYSPSVSAGASAERPENREYSRSKTGNSFTLNKGALKNRETSPFFGNFEMSKVTGYREQTGLIAHDARRVVFCECNL